MLTEVGSGKSIEIVLFALVLFSAEAMVPSLVILIIAVPGGMLLNRRSCVGSKLATESGCPTIRDRRLTRQLRSAGCFQLMPMRGGKKIRIAFYLLAAGGAALFTVAADSARGATRCCRIRLRRLVDCSSRGLSPRCPGVCWTRLPGGRCFRNPSDRRCGKLFWMRWIGESISNLIPSGGGWRRYRARAPCHHHRYPMAAAAASVIVDITLGVVTQICVHAAWACLACRGHWPQPVLVGPTLIGAVLGSRLPSPASTLRSASACFVSSASSSHVSLSRQEWSSLVQRGETLDQHCARILWAAARRSSRACVDDGFARCQLRRDLYRATLLLACTRPSWNALILQSMAMTVKSAAFACSRPAWGAGKRLPRDR